MKTFIWANHELSFTSHRFFVAHAENLADARLFIKKQLQCDYEAKIKEIHNRKEEYTYRDSPEYLIMLEGWLEDEKEQYELNTSSIDKYEPSHIISEGTAMSIFHANY